MSSTLPQAPRRKLALMFDGIRYSEALGAAAAHAFPNYYPYRFQPGEPDPTGQGKAAIPYLMRLGDGTSVRVRGAAGSPWTVSGSPEQGYALERPGETRTVTFEPLPGWMRAATSDGLPMAQAGLSLHGDMAVVNVAPGCQYFAATDVQGASQRCTFCTYGAPDARTRHLGQDMARTAIPDLTYRRLLETLERALAEVEIRHIYLVGGSMRDWAAEGERFTELARRVQSVVDRRVPVACGSGALPEESLRTLHGDGLVDSVCFNLEVWSKPLFERVCPGKQRFVGYERWLSALERAVTLWGPGRVYSAMVAGVELEPEHGLDWEQAAALAIRGADDLCARGVIPIYSLYWPGAGRDRPEHLADLLAYFERLALGYRSVREARGLRIWDGFMCRRCAYMQIECDVDEALDGRHG